MGLDGFSMGNIGLPQKRTSAQMASESEKIALKGANRDIKDVEELESKRKSKRKSFDEENEEPVYYFEKDENEDEDDDYDDGEMPTFSKSPKSYTVRLNNKTQLIELVDLDSGTIIETITPTDLVKLVSKLSSTSGILVNRKI